MNNKYENNLRTHYTPLKRSKYYKTNNSCILNKSKGNCKKELKLDISYNDNHKQAKYRNQTPINSNILSRNKTFFDYNNEKTLDINLIKKEKLNKSFNKIHPYYFQDKLQLIEKEKINEKIKNALDFAEKIKDNEFKLTFDETLDQNTKDEIGKKILELGEEQKKVEKDIDEKYKNKIEELKEEFKNQNIHNFEWIKNLKEKYSSDIDTSIYNYIGN